MKELLYQRRTYVAECWQLESDTMVQDPKGKPKQMYRGDWAVRRRDQPMVIYYVTNEDFMREFEPVGRRDDRVRAQLTDLEEGFREKFQGEYFIMQSQVARLTQDVVSLSQSKIELLTRISAMEFYVWKAIDAMGEAYDSADDQIFRDRMQEAADALSSSVSRHFGQPFKTFYDAVVRFTQAKEYTEREPSKERRGVELKLYADMLIALDELGRIIEEDTEKQDEPY